MGKATPSISGRPPAGESEEPGQAPGDTSSAIGPAFGPGGCRGESAKRTPAAFGPRGTCAPCMETGAAARELTRGSRDSRAVGEWQRLGR